MSNKPPRLIQFTAIGIMAAILATITGCDTTPCYRGDGKIKNTSYFADGSLLCYSREYAIRLASFDMSTNIQAEFNLGELSSFRDPRIPIITICIRFKEPYQHPWHHFDKTDTREVRIADKFGWRNLDDLKSSFGYRLSNQSGELLTQPEMPLTNYTWGGSEIDSDVGYETEIRNNNQICTPVPAGSKLKLWVSYKGDPSFTNRADFVVLWRWR